MTGRRFRRTTEAIPRRPWKSTSAFASRPIEISKNTGTQRARARYDLYGPLVVQSYWSPTLGTFHGVFRSRGQSQANNPNTSSQGFSSLGQRTKKCTRPPPKVNLWGTFLASKKNFPGRWWIQKPYENQENHIYHRNLSSVAPIFFGKEKFCTGAGQCMLSFSQWGPKSPRQSRERVDIATKKVDFDPFSTPF